MAEKTDPQKVTDKAEDKGFLGVETDPTPNEEYSLEKPNSWAVPEADEKAAAAAGSNRFAGKGA